ncbi:hypothetical protein PFICI_05123 [Pestalotiopsis fici W106-1]|uniref:AB hydrolase-1 domain-containing protein n=1 Tax=Pestalotiopsis fici (strain W106-1 / CGMCC3.15140) TaxID=1229662 RepID=W3XCW4_PESFW|nr:uncharacterized protein PFICI_05123 [Pestalotiopsis fici W106-1]ETS83247.1 hypothetical protein PFICI_05123 [Pestalotiopsis fici W106-1]
METQQTAKTQYIQSGDINFAYRRFGKEGNGSIPLLFCHHFRAPMDVWDPLLINAIAAQRPVILFDNAGVGKTTGSPVDNSIAQMAQHALDLLAALEISKVDILGFSMGGFVAPLVHLNGPRGLVRKLIIAGSGPSAGEDLKTHSQERKEAINAYAAGPEVTLENMQKLFFYDSDTSRKAGEEWFARITERNESTSGEPRAAWVSEGYADGGAGLQSQAGALARWGNLEFRHEGSYDRLHEISVPVFIAQGKDDFMVPTYNSFVMQQKISNARLKIFPDSGHGFLYQFAEEFAEDVLIFLD